MAIDPFVHLAMLQYVGPLFTSIHVHDLLTAFERSYVVDKL